MFLSDWEWFECRKDEVIFFIESFSESGNVELMVIILCIYIFFLLDLEIDNSFYFYLENVLLVLKICKIFL